jgi:hypothetical protein
MLDSLVDFSLYFANSGLNTRLNLLNTGRVWWMLFVLVFLASVAKIVPVTLTTKLCTRKSWYYCASMGVLMNTRGIVQLIVLNIGVELKVISPVIFAMFVLMATILTFSTSPILYILYRHKYDPKILEEPTNVQDLHLDLEGGNNLNDHNEDLPTISRGEPDLPLQRHISNGSVEMNGIRKSFQMSYDARLSSLRSNPYGERYQSRRPSRMTLF